jgi:hypothetical protein
LDFSAVDAAVLTGKPALNPASLQCEGRLFLQPILSILREQFHAQCAEVR